MSILPLLALNLLVILQQPELTLFKRLVVSQNPDQVLRCYYVSKISMEAFLNKTRLNFCAPKKSSIPRVYFTWPKTLLKELRNSFFRAHFVNTLYFLFNCAFEKKRAKLLCAILRNINLGLIQRAALFRLLFKKNKIISHIFIK